MDMNKLRRELDSIKGGMEDINKLLLETENASVNMVSRLSDLSSIANKGGIVRSIVTRATAGIPSVYQLMQQLSSVLLVFRYLVIAKKADLKQEQELIEGLKRKEEVQKRIFKLNQALSGSSLSALEKEKFYNDTSIKHMMRTMSFQEALLTTSKKFLGVKTKLQKIDDKVFKSSRKNFVRKNYGNRGLAGGSLLGKAGILMADDETGRLEGRKEGLEDEFLAENLRKFNASNKLKMATTELEKREAKANLSIIEARLEAFSDAISNVTDEIQGSADNSQSLIRGARGFSVSGDRGSRAFTDLTPHEKFMQKVEKIKLIFITKLRGIQTGLKMFFAKGNLKMLGNTLKSAGAFLKYGLLAITTIGIIAYMLQKADFFSKTGEVFDYLKTLLKWMGGGFMTSVGYIVESFPMLISGLKDFFGGLFSGDGSKIFEGLKQIGLGLIGTLWGFGGIILKGAVILLTGVIGGALTLLIGALYTVVALAIDAFENVKENTGNALLGGIAGGIGGAALGGIAGGLIAGVATGGVGTGAGIILGAKIGGAIGGITGIRDGMASGGTNLLGGAYLVGENGPETVLLPGGSSVINNTNTRGSMGTTINVHVNGRVGASDQELNQLADKIGQKISMRMNRFSPTGMRG